MVWQRGLNVQDRDGITALMHAAFWGYLDMVNHVLDEHDADTTSLVDLNGHTLLQWRRNPMAIQGLKRESSNMPKKARRRTSSGNAAPPLTCGVMAPLLLAVARQHLLWCLVHVNRITTETASSSRCAVEKIFLNLLCSWWLCQNQCPTWNTSKWICVHETQKIHLQLTSDIECIVCFLIYSKSNTIYPTLLTHTHAATSDDATLLHNDRPWAWAESQHGAGCSASDTPLASVRLNSHTRLGEWPDARQPKWVSSDARAL